MKKIVLALGMTTLLFTTSSPALGRGRGGGSLSRGGMAGGMSRPAMHAPSMSRPSMPASRPNVSRPAPARPSIPNMSRPSTPSVRPPTAGTRPSWPTTRPGAGGTPGFGGAPGFTRPGGAGPRPSLPAAGGNRPNLPSSGGNTRPNLPNGFPGNGANPNVARPGTRPSPSDVGDFLNLPGGNRPTTRPSTRPSVERPENRPTTLPATRPNTNRPQNGSRPSVGNQAGIGNSLSNKNIRNKFQGGHNVSVGDIDVNVRNNNVNSVRNRWNGVSNRPFDRNWWVDPGFSRPPAYWRWQTGWGRYPGGWCWRPCTWVVVGGWFTWNAVQPISYSYGTNVVYRDNYVYIDEQQAAPADEFYSQAATIADSIPENVQPESVEWLPLGVYAIADAEGIDTGMMLQLAVSKEGIVAGTFYNSTTEDERPVEGMVDRESQRAAWHFADKETTVVMEAGIYDLTQDETPALLHFDQNNTQNWLLVRLPEPEDETSE